MKLLTARETAGLLRISLTGLWRLQKDKKIRVIKIGRRALFDQADLERFINENKHPQRIARI
jgi:excisionase family DNA binding protein